MRISIFGFDSFELVKNCRSKLPVYSDALLQDLGKRSRQQNVVFIAHGIAGWVVKHAFSSYKSAQGYLSPGVMFLGLPQFEGVGEWTQFLDHFSGNNISKGPKLDFPRFGAKSTKDPTSSDYDREQDFLFLQSICQDFDIIQDSGYGPAVFTATAEDMDVVPVPSPFCANFISTNL
jgi:predicted alpha/beta hydrolase family esterase